jgi:hypothetical protein
LGQKRHLRAWPAAPKAAPNRGLGRITQTHKNQDEAITYLAISGETLETTPNHPFYLEKAVDNSKRPIPEGYQGLSEHWIGAGDLKPGDAIRKANGTTGIVQFVKTVRERSIKYNLTVDTAHTYFVGNGQWLVHNAGNTRYDFRGVTADSDVYSKGVHFKDNLLKGFELRIKPTHDPRVFMFEAVFAGQRGTKNETAAVAAALQAFENDPEFRKQLYSASQRVLTTLEGIVMQGGSNAAKAQKMQVETYFTMKGLAKVVGCE